MLRHFFIYMSYQILYKEPSKQESIFRIFFNLKLKILTKFHLKKYYSRLKAGQIKKNKSGKIMKINFKGSAEISIVSAMIYSRTRHAKIFGGRTIWP